MKLAVLGSRKLKFRKFNEFLPWELALMLPQERPGERELVSGDDAGIDTYIKRYAKRFRFAFREFTADYKKYGETAVWQRNKEIVDYSDVVCIFWNGRSKNTKEVIDYCRKINKLMKIYIV
ncbi:MAG: hypothetical protein LUG21_09000 [Clostridiales bacterium]|nr:hypothetical protein [Clostridiales bacterium]